MTGLLTIAAVWLVLLVLALPVYLVLCALSWVADRTWDTDHELASWLVKATLILAIAGVLVSGGGS